ncbi:MAG: Sapep family Mn(2+)-dependent dipeptidase [Lachnospiraceae bacterium]
MQGKFDKQIDEWIDAHREAMVEDIKRLVSIPSVSDPTEETKPFGKECRRAMDDALALAREHGFVTENHEYYVGCVSEKKVDPKNTIGFWNHLDVVPAGEGWERDPYEPFEKEGYLIGRGVGDNKGPAVGMIYLMQCMRELNIPLRHDFCLYLGTNEEKQMADMEYFASHYQAPALSVIADSGFPVCYGEKGILEGTFTSIESFSDKVQEVAGGQVSNMIPDRAWAIIKGTEDEAKVLKDKAPEGITVSYEDEMMRVSAKGTSRHSAFPEGSTNAIFVLASFLKDVATEERDRRIFAFLADACDGYYGKTEGISYEDAVSGKTTCAGTVLKMKNKKAELTVNIRYSITADPDKMEAQLHHYASSFSAKWDTYQNSKPNYFPKEHPAVKVLTDYYNEATGLKTEAFVMGGGTYARKLPNAFAYGIGGMTLTKKEQEAKAKLFAPGHGGAHEPDEALYLRTYFDAIKIFAKAMVRLDACEL